LPDSFYLSQKPCFYGTLNWPSVGGDQPGGTIPALTRWQSGDYIPLSEECSYTLRLTGSPADQAIRLNWQINAPVPPTITWKIDYYTQTTTSPLTVTNLISTTRNHTLTNLTNGQWYTVTLYAMLDNAPWLSDTIRALATDKFVYLPVVMK
jgi:hypothetical protein